MCQPGRPGPQGLSHDGSPGLAAFQRAKSAGCSFCSPGLDARAGHHRVQAAVRELPVVLLGRHPEVNVAVGRIGEALLHQARDDLDHRRDLLGGAGVDVGGQDVQAGHLGGVLGDELFGQLLGRDAQVVGPGDDAVVDIGVVLDVAHLVAAVLQVAAQHVEDDVAHGVAQVALVVGRDAADVHLHRAWAGHELFLLAGEGVVQLHPASSLAAARGPDVGRAFFFSSPSIWAMRSSSSRTRCSSRWIVSHSGSGSFNTVSSPGSW